MTPQSPAPVAGRPLTAEADPIEPCGGCGETNPSRRCLGCLHDFVSRPASDQPVEAIGAGREELVAYLYRRADACHDLMKPGLSTRDAMRLHGKEAAYRHAAHLVNAALSPASLARTPMGDEALREALECVEDYDHTGRLAGVLRQAIDGAVRIDHLTPDQQSDIRAHITGLSDPEEDTYQAPEHGWTCFHCGATFKTTRGARMHFGHNVTGRPKCHDPERLVEIYDGAEAAVAAASPARADFEVRVARRDEARNAIIAALAAPTPMGGEVEALRGALERIKEGGSWQGDAASDALAASSPSPAQGGIATWHPLDDNGMAEVRINGKRITTMPSYPGAEEVAQRINAALAASPQPEAGEAADWSRDLTAAPEGEAVLLATSAGHVGEAIAPVRDDPDDDWFWAGAGFVHANHKPVAWKRLPTHPDAPPSVQPVEGK